MLQKVQNRLRRANRTRSRIEGTSERPRLSVFRSNTHISVQAIDDVTGITLSAASDLQITSGTKSEKAHEVGKLIAKSLLEKGITACIYDRGGYLYHGRVQSLAEGARSEGLVF